MWPPVNFFVISQRSELQNINNYNTILPKSNQRSVSSGWVWVTTDFSTTSSRTQVRMWYNNIMCVPIIRRGNYRMKLNSNFYDAIGKFVQFRFSKSHISYSESLKKKRVWHHKALKIRSSSVEKSVSM